VTAISPENVFANYSASEEFLVSIADLPLYLKYSLYIIGALVALSVVGGLVYFFKVRAR
jgi:hypothetical protein